jgi:hypothetical protein
MPQCLLLTHSGHRVARRTGRCVLAFARHMRRRDFITFVSGVAASCPLSAHAQQPTIPVVGFMSGRSPPDSEYLVSAFQHGLTETGFAEGKLSGSNTAGPKAITTDYRLLRRI